MNTTHSLPEQRLALRRKLMLQRQRIVHLLSPARDDPGGFPRSMTMRFLLRRRPLVGRILSEAAIVLLGPRLIRSLSGLVGLAGAVRSAAPGARKRLPWRSG